MTDAYQGLYRGTTNNGVHTVLTAQAVRAILRSKELLRQGDATNRAAIRHQEEIAAVGTFTFVSVDKFTDWYRGYVTGTLLELDEWTGGGLPLSPVGNYVPFSTGTKDDDILYVRTAADVIESFGFSQMTAKVDV